VRTILVIGLAEDVEPLPRFADIGELAEGEDIGGDGAKPS
jgi:hypothetical protein